MKDINQILEELKTRAKELAPNFIWEPQTVVSRLFLALPAKEFENTYIVAEYLHKLFSFNGLMELVTDEAFKNKLAEALRLSLSDIESLVEKDIEYIGERHNVIRKKAKPAQGVVNLYFYTPDAVTIPDNLKFKTRTGVEFAVKKGFGASPLYDAETGLYKVPALVECLTEGTIGNVPAKSIIYIEGYLPNFAGCWNPYPFINGRDVEDLAEFVTRLRNVLVSNAIGSKSWLEAFFLQNDNVLDAVVLIANDKELLKRYGAEVWVVDYEELEEYTEDADELVVNLPPVVRYDNAVLYRRSPEEDIYSYSIYGVERLVRIDSGIPMKYWIDKTIYYLQQLLLYPEWYYIGGERNIVVRKAIPAEVYIKVDVYPIPQVIDPLLLVEQIRSDLNIFFTGGRTSYGKVYTRCRIGKKIDVSDIVAVIIDNPNVDRIDLDSLVVKILPDRFSQYGVLTLKFYEYPIFSPESKINIK